MAERGYALLGYAAAGATAGVLLATRVREKAVLPGGHTVYAVTDSAWAMVPLQVRGRVRGSLFAGWACCCCSASDAAAAVAAALACSAALEARKLGYAVCHFPTMCYRCRMRQLMQPQRRRWRGCRRRVPMATSGAQCSSSR